MDFFLSFNTTELSNTDCYDKDGIVNIVLFEVSEFPNYDVSTSLKTVFTLTNGADQDEMPHFAAVQLCLHCLAKYSYKSH